MAVEGAATPYPYEPKSPLYWRDRCQAVEVERDRLREALLVAADDLDKAANQFAGLTHMDAASIRRTISANPGIFISKAARARAASNPKEH